MKKATYTTLFIVGAFIAFWIALPKNQDIPQESTNVESNSPKTSITLNTHNSEFVSNSNPHLNTLEVDSDYCDNRCQQNIELLRLQVALSDTEYEELLNRSDELVTFLRQNPNFQSEFIDMASNTSPAHRNIIMVAFDELDVSARLALGDALIESSDWHSRFDGIKFLAQEDIIDEQLALQFSNMLSAEPDHYVRSNIVKALNQPDKFYGNEEIISSLEQAAYSDEDDVVRGESLLARVELEIDPETVFNDTFAAIRSNQADYRAYGLRALEKIMNKQSSNGLEISWQYQDEAKTLFKELLTPKYDNMPADFLNKANDLLEPYSEK